MRAACALYLLYLLAVATAAAQERSFLACPIVRDTKTAPCFLAEYEGELYYLGIQQDINADFHPPQLKHEVLVEGRVEKGPRVCGGIPLKPLAISVIKEVNPACNTLLPAEPGIEAPPAGQGGPASHRPIAEPWPAEESLAGRQEFTLLFAFDDDFVDFGSIAILRRAAGYALKIGASAVKVNGYRATSLLSNGQRLVEKPGLAKKRAQEIATLLEGLGVNGVAAEWKDDPEPGDGNADPSHRRVTITVIP